MGHCRVWRGTVPMFLPRRKLHHIVGVDFLDKASFTLNEAKPGGRDQGWPQRMGMPGRTCARFEGDAGACRAVRFLGVKKGWIDADRAGEPVGGALDRSPVCRFA